MTKVFISKTIHQQIVKLRSFGGNFQRAASQLESIIYRIQVSDNPISVMNTITMTNHGESRIKHCIKYDLPGHTRLITIQDNGFIVLVFFGTHNESDNWLERNKGLTIATKDISEGLLPLYISNSLDTDLRINPKPDYSGTFLYLKLKHYWEKISEGLTPLIKRSLAALTAASTDEDIKDIAENIQDSDKAYTIFDVFMALRGGLVGEAKSRILDYESKLKSIDNLSNDELSKISSNDQYLKLDDLRDDEMKMLMSSKSMIDFMLYLHPAQKNVVEKDFNGSARLLGVSGSGKTCIIVRRSVRLAEKYNGQKILILTLNQALSTLISQLVDNLLENSNQNHLKDYIEVKSFWEICRELLIEIRNQPIYNKILGPKTHRHNESIESVWEEYYKCENNNDDANVLFPIHLMLLSRDVYPQEYIKQEFDWIRSFIPYDKIEEYLQVQRENRAIPLTVEERKLIINGLAGWRNKMTDVGAIDYLGLANDLFPSIQEVSRKYRSILVDEIQDFGTIELSIIRKLVDPDENDLFLCGDIAQQVYNKHHQIRVSGITILPDAYMKILKNYRNSREILTAAYSFFKVNVDELKYKSEDFEVLNPEYANFSSPKPFLRRADSLTQEFKYAISYLHDILDVNEKGCISICDHSIFDIEQLSIEFDLPLLNGSNKINENQKIFLSDLEQTKGFEFDIMIIINASDGIFPNPSYPQEENFREISKFYVAMTRAKKELVISYSKKISTLFNECKEYFSEDNWDKHCNVIDNNKEIPLISRQSLPIVKLSQMTGKSFLYHPKAVGTKKELQSKLLLLVEGKSVSQNKKTIGWRNMEEFKRDIMSGRDVPHFSRLLGRVVYDDIKQLFQNINV